MKVLPLIIGVITACAVTLASLVASMPLVFADRVIPGVQLQDADFSGITESDLPGALRQYEQQLRTQTLAVKLGEETYQHSLGDLGVSLDIPATTAVLLDKPWWHSVIGIPAPRLVLVIDPIQLEKVIVKDFASQITPPHNAGLRLSPAGILEVIPSKTGEGIDLVTFQNDVTQRIYDADWEKPVELVKVAAAPAILDPEVEPAKAYATRLLREGFQLRFAEKVYDMKPFTVTRLLTFVEQVDPANPQNHVLGVAFASEALREYLTNTVAPDLEQPAIDARFEITEEEQAGRVTQFALPQEGRKLNFDVTAQALAQALTHQQVSGDLVVDTTQPAVAAVEDIEALGIKELLATGVSDFSGSPRNRIHNIEVGTARYHGLLIAPAKEFSFNEFLGPVDGEHGFKPELVIKHNVTKPEFGGGLCQVSTTVFRAAVQAGLDITARRNHAYAVRYYGKPGFDATIYPPYTDLRFTNNTPGYILIQARIEGKQLTFEFWGTSDGRQVEVEGPVTYAHQPDGAVKATLTQRVLRDGQVVSEEDFYSNYKSPNLFPKVLREDDPQRVSQPTINEPTPTPANPAGKPTPTVTPKPKATATPKPTPSEEN
jgi:vancomycin resistance protein YoaR